MGQGAPRPKATYYSALLAAVPNAKDDQVILRKSVADHIGTRSKLSWPLPSAAIREQLSNARKSTERPYRIEHGLERPVGDVSVLCGEEVVKPIEVPERPW